MKRTRNPVSARRFSLCALALVIWASLPAICWGQTASINGTVTDPSGAVVPQARIVAQNLATNAARETTSSDAGTYTLTEMVPGTYNVTVEKTGFQTVRFAEVMLTVDQALTLDAKLAVSTTALEVTVSGDAVAPINTTDSQVSNIVVEKQIQDLPLILRDPYQLVLLSAGATQTNSGLGGFSINGSRERSNNFLLDGTNNNDAGVPGSGLLTLNPDATQEFRVITDNYLPEFGRNSGSVVDIVTRSGTNDFHGDVYYFGRWDALGARDFFDTAAVGPKAPYVRNTFGTSVGGPVKKDKFFFFFNYEGNRFATSTISNATVPTAAYKTGKFTYTDPVSGVTSNIDVSSPGAGNNATSLPLDPQIQKVLNFFPAANGADVLPGISALYFFPEADSFNADNYIGKVDYNISSRNTLSVRYLASNVNESNSGGRDVFPGIGGVGVTSLSQSLNGHLSTVLRSDLLNDFYATGNRSSETFFCPGFQTIDSLSLAGVDVFGRGRDWGLPAFTSIECVPLGDSDGQSRPFGSYNIGDSMTWTKGRHTMKFGYEFADEYENGFDDFSSRSLPNFAIFTNTGTSALTNLPANAVTVPTAQDSIWGLLGGVFQETQAQFFTTGGTRVPSDSRGQRERDMYGFWQDQFKLTSNFTFNYGLRYEWDGVPWIVNDQLTSASPAALAGPSTITFQTVTRGGANPLYVNDVKGFEPRIGFAWDPFKNGKTSIRAGFGYFRDRNFFNIVGNTRANPPLQGSFVNNVFNTVGPEQISNIPFPATLAAPSATIPSFPNPGNGIFPATISNDFHVAYVQQRNLGIQRELGWHTTLEVNYVGNKGNRLIRVIDGNPPIPSLVAQLRAFCQNPSNAFGCVDSPTASPSVETVQGSNLYIGQQLGVLPFNAVNNSAAFHANQTASVANSNYNGLQTNVRRQLSHGMSFQANYTWSHAIDNAGDPLVQQLNQTFFPANTFELKREKGSSSFDVRHRFVLNYTAELPAGTGKDHLNRGLVGKALEGWSWSGIATLQSGFPYDIFAPGIDSDGTGATQRPDFNPNATLTPPPTNPSGPVTGPNPGLFSFPLFGGPGNLGRNHFVGPDYKNFDMVFTKMTHFTERFSLEFRAESYNLLNHPNFNPPDDNLGDLTFSQSLSEVGRNDGTTGSRQLQFAMKLHF